ncbi:hypothetical protein AB0J52_20295 [Spirillospora sp. NPDC049652]
MTAVAAPRPDAAEFLAVLRAEFPGVAFAADSAAGRWFAVRGKSFFVRAVNGLELREKLLAAGLRPRETGASTAARRPAAPDRPEGRKGAR